MTPRERAVVRAIIKALSVPRNRFGKLDGDFLSNKDVDDFAQVYKLPHGGYDRVDKATMLLQALVGDPITSIRDVQP